MKIIKYILIISVLLLVGAVVVYNLFTSGYLRLNYPSFTTYPIHGIDVSHHQQTIDWDVLLAKETDYVQFVFMKATEGTTHVDSKFAENRLAVQKKNIPMAAYHFFTFCSRGADQAAHFINIVPNDSLALPPAVDLEFGGNCKYENRLPNLLEEIVDYINIVEQHYRKKVIIYATQDFYDLYLRDQLLENPIWIRDVYKEPKLENGRRWVFWQYANRGRLEGIETFIDINVFEGMSHELENLRRETF